MVVEAKADDAWPAYCCAILHERASGQVFLERRPATADIFSRLEANKRRLEKEIVGGGRSGFAPGAWQVYDPNQGGARRMRMASKRAAFAR